MKLIITLIAFVLFAGFTAKAQSINKTVKKMEVAVWDTYVTKKDGSVMHFDIIAPAEIKEPTIIHGYGREYLEIKGQEGQSLTSKECRFCHIEALRASWKAEIEQKGYFIIEMENCN
ncbi:MAG: DUF2024 family protein [Bacteroidia bacterium]